MALAVEGVCGIQEGQEREQVNDEGRLDNVRSAQDQAGFLNCVLRTNQLNHPLPPISSPKTSSPFLRPPAPLFALASMKITLSPMPIGVAHSFCHRSQSLESSSSESHSRKSSGLR